MFCPKCGVEIPDNSVFCPQCGYNIKATSKSVGNVAETVGSSNQIYRPDAITLIAIIDIVFGIFGFLFGILMVLSVPGILTGSYPSYFVEGHMMGPLMTNFMNLMMTVMVYSLLIAGIPMIIAGVGLLGMKSWGRILHVLAWIPGLLMFPVGTLISIFAIWVVYTREANEAFMMASR